MSPWWLRPTAEGAEEAPQDKAPHDKAPQDKGQKTRPETAEPSDGGNARRTRGGGERRRSRPRSNGERGAAKRETPRDGGETAKKETEKGAAGRSRGRGRERGANGGGKGDGGGRAAKPAPRGGREAKPTADKERGAKGRGEPREEAGRDERPRQEYTFDDDLSQSDFAAIRREILSIPERNQVSDERKIALFCDLENVALGVRDSEVKKFDIDMVLERLLEKGKIIVKKAYCDWERYSEYKRAFHEAAIEMIDIPQKYYSGKNSADIKMVVDAMDLSFSKEHLDTFVILSGDSDFSPLVSKLKENNKYVIGIGVKGSSSNLLIDNCDEFIYYEDLWRDRQKAPRVDGSDSKKSEAFRLMVDAIQALLRDNKDVLWGSMIKQTMQRKKPSFSESYHGYSTFSELLEDAERSKLIKLKKDQRSGTYIVTGFAQR